MTKQPTILIGADGIEYVIRGGKIREKCLHKTVRDESAGKMRKEVCHDCGKVLIYNPDTTASSDPFAAFRELHGREPRGNELYSFM